MTSISGARWHEIVSVKHGADYVSKELWRMFIFLQSSGTVGTLSKGSATKATGTG